MNNFKKFFDYFFLIFLIVYLILMLGHLKEINFGIWTSLIFLAGLTLAVFAHAKRNYITVILLVVHMSIEWFEWSQIGFSATGGATLNIVHIFMDLIFLVHELSAHVKKYVSSITILVTVFLVIIFYFGHNFLNGSLAVEEIVEYINSFVIAGILGCVGSHLGYHIKRLFISKGQDPSCNHNH